MIFRASLLVILSFTSAYIARGQEIAIVNGILIDGLGNIALNGFDVLVHDGKITKIGRNLSIPKNVKKINATGKTIIPGLIDMHGHLYALGASQLEAFPYLYLAGGVTTIFSPGEFEPEKVLALKNAINKDLAIGPDILFAPYFDTRQSFDNWMHPVSDSVELIERFESWKNRIDGIKVYSNISKEHFDLLTKKAKQNNLVITGHLGSLETRFAIDHGINGLEHGLFSIRDFGGDPNSFFSFLCFLSNLDLTSRNVQELVELIVSKKVYVDPTTVAMESFLSDFKPQSEDYSSYLTEKANNYFAKAFLPLSNNIDQVCLRGAIAKQLQFTKLIFDNKGLLVAGTDPVSPKVLPGFGIKSEIKLFVLAGIPIVDAIRIASYNGATALKITRRTGSIEVGKNADLVIIDGDITQNIDHIDKVQLVLKNGVTYDPIELLKKAKGKIDSGSWVLDK